MHIIPADFTDPRVIALVDAHLARVRVVSPPESVHALNLARLKDPAISFWTVADGDAIVGMGALKLLAPDHGEVKSMYVAEAARGRGFGAAMLRHIIAAAKAEGMARLSLESGSREYFIPAHRLYAALGFAQCGPFGDYKPDPISVFMTMDLTQR
jgi:putative acetyltransferase